MTISRPDAMAELWQSAVTLVEQLDPHDWQRPVPWCPEWKVADLVSHLGGLQAWMNQAHPNGDSAPAAANESPFDQTVTGLVAARRNWEPAQRLDELREASAAHIAHLRDVDSWLEPAQGPLGTTTQDGLFRVRTYDVWVHLADLREAIGHPIDLDDTSEGATAAHLYVLGLVPWMFAKRAGAAEGATLRMTLSAPLEHDSVLEVVQRRATWNPAADPGACSVTAKPAALTLLVSGRGDGQRWRDAQALSWTGPRGSEFVERARLF